jgi:hypothetical protein
VLEASLGILFNSLKTSQCPKCYCLGRVHSAVISGIDLETRSVTVEWFEKGETKGKEVELEALFQLNPDLLPQQRVSKHITMCILNSLHMFYIKCYYTMLILCFRTMVELLVVQMFRKLLELITEVG